MPASTDLLALGDERFVSFTTFRKSGERVSTPVWVERDGDALVVTTPVGSGKVKRLRNSPRVELRPCGRFGAVQDGVEPVEGVAELVADDAAAERATALIRSKYGLEYKVVMGLEGLGSGSGDRVVVRITEP